MTTYQNIFGPWDVYEKQCRIDGEWIHKREYVLYELMILFLTADRYTELFRRGEDDEEVYWCQWVVDEDSKVITLHENGRPNEVIKYAVFEGEWLYYTEKVPGAMPSGQEIIERYAQERLKVVKG